MSVANKDICWFTPHANHYHHYLMQKCSENSLSIDTIYFSKSISKYPWKTDFDDKSESLAKGVFGIDWLKAFDGLKEYKTTVVAGWGEPTMMVLLSIRAFLGKSYYLYTDTPQSKVRTGLKQKLRAVWLKYILDKSTGILTTGKPGLNYFKGQGIDESKLINFPFVTNLEFFTPDISKTSDKSLIFSSGRLDNAHKGYNVALDALSNVKNDFIYKVAGSGPDEVAINNQILTKNLSDKVELLGWTEPSELVEYYKKCDVFLHSSNFDPFPNAVLEAMACGCLVVASDKAGSAIDRIQSGENGFLFESGNSNDLVQKLQKALDLSYAERIVMKSNARKTAENWSYLHNIQMLKTMLN